MELIMGADRLLNRQTTGFRRPHRRNAERSQTTGGTGVSKFTEIISRTQEISKFPTDRNRIFVRVTKASWGEQLDENTDGVLRLIRRSSCHPDPARITEIPKEDDNSRLLAISCAAKPINNQETIENKKEKWIKCDVRYRNMENRRFIPAGATRAVMRLAA